MQRTNLAYAPTLEQRIKREKVPQVSLTTGVSGDYANVLGGLVSFYNAAKSVGKDFDSYILPKLVMVMEMDKLWPDGPFPTYTQLFPEDKFRDVVTDKNEERIKELDKIVKIANNWYAQRSFSETEFLDVAERFYTAVYGSVSKMLAYKFDQYRQSLQSTPTDHLRPSPSLIPS